MHHQPGEHYHPGFWFGLLGCAIHQDREYKNNTPKGKISPVLSLLKVSGKQPNGDDQLVAGYHPSVVKTNISPN